MTWCGSPKRRTRSHVRGGEHGEHLVGAVRVGLLARRGRRRRSAGWSTGRLHAGRGAHARRARKRRDCRTTARVLHRPDATTRAARALPPVHVAFAESRAMAQDEDIRIEPFTHAAGGWTSVKEVAHALGRGAHPARRHAHPAQAEQARRLPVRQLLVGQAGRPAPGRVLRARRQGHRVGADHRPLHARVLRRSTRSPSSRAGPTSQLESTGRLTAPLRWDAATRQVRRGRRGTRPSTDIGARLKALEPKEAVFYASGRASLETSYMYALMARLYGNNNLPDSSNMCHESTSSGLPKSIGVPVGTVQLEDFEQHRLHLHHGPQHRHQRAAHAARPAGLPRARRAHPRVQPAQGAGPGALRQPAVAGADAHAGRHGDEHAVPPAQGRRRPRRR